MTKRPKVVHGFTVRLSEEAREALWRLAATREALPASVAREMIVEALTRQDEKYRRHLEEKYGVSLPVQEPPPPPAASAGYRLNDRP